jgi:hypothetical protein
MEEIFYKEGLPKARLIGHSKSQYREDHPDNDVMFNANIFVLGDGKVWYGDLDLTLDDNALKRVASELGKDLFILSEYAGRFENEKLSDPEIIKNSKYKISK